MKAALLSLAAALTIACVAPAVWGIYQADSGELGFVIEKSYDGGRWQLHGRRFFCGMGEQIVGPWRFLSAGAMYYPNYERAEVWIPKWMLLVYVSVPAAGWSALLLRRVVGHRRQATAGFCSHCSYDLRATPDRCPECGHMTVGDLAVA